jgi:hypothetical protein
MRTIQMTLDDDLVKTVDIIARGRKTTRSAFTRKKLCGMRLIFLTPISWNRNTNRGILYIWLTKTSSVCGKMNKTGGTNEKRRNKVVQI